MKVVVAGVIDGVAAKRTRVLSLRRIRGTVFPNAGGGTSSSIDRRGDSVFEGASPAFAGRLPGGPAVVGTTPAGRD